MKKYFKNKAFHLPSDLLVKHKNLFSAIVQNIQGGHASANKLSLRNQSNICKALAPLYDKFKEKNDMNTPNEHPAIGIDLGTTYSCVAIYEQGQVQIIPSEFGLNVVPSYVAFHPFHGEMIGDAAKNQAHENPIETIFDSKRLIGRKFMDEFVQNDVKLWPFKVVQKLGSDTPQIQVKGSQYEPEEISAKLLIHLKKLAEENLKGRKVGKAVITVPAYFNDGQRQATIDAGEIAGLEVLQIVNEPTAAAIAYYLHQSPRSVLFDSSSKRAKNILVYDLGGGTFDVSILSIEFGSGEINVKAVNGDTHLGGEDFDNQMVEHCIKKFHEKTGRSLDTAVHPYIGIGHTMVVSPHTNDIEVSRRLRRLRNECERRKKDLSSAQGTTVVVEAIMNGVNLNVPITRHDFEVMNKQKFDLTIQIVQKALLDAKLSKSDIDEIVMVGGSTRIPKIRELLMSYFDGKEVCISVNPDEAVARGAAILAAKLNGLQQQRLQRISLNDVCPLSLGIEVADGSLSVIIPRNTRLPTVHAKHNYATHHNNQTSVTIVVYEGEQKRARDNHLLGKFILSNIPPKRRGEERLNVTMDINKQGILHVTAVCESTGESNHITINEQKGRLTKDEKDKLRKVLG